MQLAFFFPPKQKTTTLARSGKENQSVNAVLRLLNFTGIFGRAGDVLTFCGYGKTHWSALIGARLEL
jgi:hypothetical protein